MKRVPTRLLIYLLVGASMLVTLAFSSVVAAQPFSDVHTHWSRHYAAALDARTILSAFPDGTFRPDNAVTRAEFTKMLVAALADPLPPAVVNNLPPVFADVSSGHWARSFVEAAWERGWIQGRGFKRFTPDQPISRAEVAVLTARAANLPATPGTPRQQFTDTSSIPDWAVAAVTATSGSGLLVGYPDGSFRPDQAMTRAEASALLVRLLQRRAMLYDAIGVIAATPEITEQNDTSTAVLLQVRLDNGQPLHLTVPTSAAVFRNEAAASAVRLQLFDEVGVIWRDGVVRYVEAWSWHDSGELVEVDTRLQRITYIDDIGRRRSRAVMPEANVFRNGRSVNLADLAAGDLLYLVLSRQGGIRALDAVRSDVRGSIWSIDLTARRLRVGPSLTRAVWYDVAPDAEIFVNGRRLQFGGLRISDGVIGSLSATGQLVYIEAYRLAEVPR